MLSVFICFSPKVFRQDLTDFARLSGQQAPEVLLSLPPGACLVAGAGCLGC